jgi:MtN3 and saliva related transmembrane protein
MNAITFIGVLAAVFSTINQLPQAWKTIRSKDTHSLSLVMYSMVWIATSLWLAYGILLKDTPLILSNSVSIIPITYILTIKVINTVTGKDAKIDKIIKGNQE